MVVQIRENTNEILQWVRKQELVCHTFSGVLPDNVPVAFPLKSEEEIYYLEEYLQDKENLIAFSSYLSTLGGKDLTAKTNNILKYLLTNALASGFSFFGKRLEKKPFSGLLLKAVIIRAVKAVSPQATDKVIENNIKVWLKHAPQRLQNEQKKFQPFIKIEAW